MVWICSESERSLANTILQGIVDGERSRARQWLDDVKEWTGLSSNETLREPEDHGAWRKHVGRVAPMAVKATTHCQRQSVYGRRTS